jgi:hypothetical protein
LLKLPLHTVLIAIRASHYAVIITSEYLAEEISREQLVMINMY